MHVRKTAVLPILVVLLLTTGHATGQDLLKGLKLHYRLDEGTGRVAMDSSGSAFHGGIFSGNWRPGPVGGQSLGFRAQGGINASTGPALATLGGLPYGTISLWFSYPGIPEGQDIVPLFYFGEDENEDPRNCVVIEVGHPGEPEDYLYFTVVVDGVIVQCFDTRDNVVLERNRWYHCGIVVSPFGNRGFLNGELLEDPHYNAGTLPDDSEFFASVATNDLLAVGYGTTGVSNFFQSHVGGVDDVRVYNRVLTLSEIAALYWLKDDPF